ncbi:acyl-CoA carboxylase epsilon subunit [Streptomyces sp. NPDC056632]|uniref:acyl-CoA carboxylase epsilon subunit n=1 Tax=unclassified Streptomyces TaxID=2593676 RepID=UPI0036765124
MTASADTTPGAPAAGTPAAGPADTFLRIEKGSPDATELAALTAVLLARTAALSGAGAEADAEPGEGADPRSRRTARWRRLERRTRTGTPRSWRDDTRR